MARPPLPREAVVQPLDQSYRIIPLTRGYSMRVGAHRYAYMSQFNWISDVRPNGDVYAYRNIRLENGHRTTLSAQREILGLIYGESVEADHIDHDTLNNVDENLRPATSAQQKQNRKKPKHGSIPYKGVGLDKRRNLLRVRLRINGETIWLGYFPRENVVEAAKTYDRAALKYFGEFAHLNFPKENYDVEKTS